MASSRPTTSTPAPASSPRTTSPWSRSLPGNTAKLLRRLAVRLPRRAGASPAALSARKRDMAILPDGAANDTPVVDIIDERLSRQSAWRRFLARPDLGAFAGVVLVFPFFGLTAGGTGMFASDGVLNWLTVTAQLMIIGTGAALLMIGGEF